MDQACGVAPCRRSFALGFGDLGSQANCLDSLAFALSP